MGEITGDRQARSITFAKPSVVASRQPPSLAPPRSTVRCQHSSPRRRCPAFSILAGACQTGRILRSIPSMNPVPTVESDAYLDLYDLLQYRNKILQYGRTALFGVREGAAGGRARRCADEAGGCPSGHSRGGAPNDTNMLDLQPLSDARAQDTSRVCH